MIASCTAAPGAKHGLLNRFEEPCIMGPFGRGARSIKVSKRFGRTTPFFASWIDRKGGARSAAAVVFTIQPFLPPSNPRDECREGEDGELRICKEGNGRRDGKEDHLTEMTLPSLSHGCAKNASKYSDDILPNRT